MKVMKRELTKDELIAELKKLLEMNKADSIRARGYHTTACRSQALTALRVEKEQLEHQILVLTGFEEAEAEKIIGDISISPVTRKENDHGKDEGEGKEPVAV